MPLSALTVLFQRDGFCPMCDMMAGWGWVGMILVVLFWIALIAAVVWLVVWLVARRRGANGQAP